MILSAGCAGVVAAAGPFTWGVVCRPGGVLARLGRLSGAWGVVAYWAYRPGGVFFPGALFGILARAGNAAPHKKALVFFINAGKFLADGGRLALFGGHITHNARAGVCFAALRE